MSMSKIEYPFRAFNGIFVLVGLPLALQKKSEDKIHSLVKIAFFGGLTHFLVSPRQPIVVG